MPNNIAKEVLLRLVRVEQQLEGHLIEGTGVKADIKWLKWINMGIAALVLFKLVADWVR
jgi:hypothetical protein